MNRSIIGPQQTQLIHHSHINILTKRPITVPALTRIRRIIRQRINQRTQTPRRQQTPMPIVNINPTKKKISLNLSRKIPHQNDGL